MPFSYEDYCAFCSIVKERRDRKRGIAAVVRFSVPNKQKVIELTFLNIVEEKRNERNKKNNAGRFGLSVTSNQTVIELLDSLIKPQISSV